jgi:signal transduction histidine kinase
VVPEILKSKISVFVELHNKNAYLRALGARLQSVQEEEQRRIARDIHDELGQALTALKMDLTWLCNHLPPDSAALVQKAKGMTGLIDGMVRTVREVSARLRPEVLDELGLAAAIRWQAREFEVRAGIRCKVDVPADSMNLDLARATAMFRVFQELLTNIARHAAATKVDVALHLQPNTLQLEVKDNGKGISEAEIRNPASLGLLGMRERVVAFGGRLKIEPRSKGGTRAIVSIPVEVDHSAGKEAVS